MPCFSATWQNETHTSVVVIKILAATISFSFLFFFCDLWPIVAMDVHVEKSLMLSISRINQHCWTLSLQVMASRVFFCACVSVAGSDNSWATPKQLQWATQGLKKGSIYYLPFWVLQCAPEPQHMDICEFWPNQNVAISSENKTYNVVLSSRTPYRQRQWSAVATVWHSFSLHICFVFFRTSSILRK